MAKTFVIESDTGEKNPFLRGVLVESLARAGLPFQDAYLIAQVIRDKLEDKTEVTTDMLREWAALEVGERFGSAMAQSYQAGGSRERRLIVRTSTDEVPFSVGILSRSLQACTIKLKDARKTAKLVYESLLDRNEQVVDHNDLKAIVFDCLKENASEAAADRYLSWQRFKNSGLPLILLIGGIAGSGKSTLSTELAYKLNIVRSQSTDMMREIVRCYLPPAMSSVLSNSSFEGWQGEVTNTGPEADFNRTELILGFLSQFEVIKPGLEATVTRAVKESHSLIVDGVHVLPSKLDLSVSSDQAIVIPLMLVVPNQNILRMRFKHREMEQPERKSSRYLEQLEQIWALQAYLVSEAEEYDIPLIINVKMEDALDDILEHISNKITQHFPARH